MEECGPCPSIEDETNTILQTGQFLDRDEGKPALQTLQRVWSGETLLGTVGDVAVPMVKIVQHHMMEKMLSLIRGEMTEQWGPDRHGDIIMEFLTF